MQNIANFHHRYQFTGLAMRFCPNRQDLAHQNSETATHWHTKLQNLDDADLVGHIKSVIVWYKLHVSLLLAIRPMRQVMDQIISKETSTGNLAKDARQINYLIRVLTFFAWMSYIFLTAALIFFLSALRSTMKTRVLLSSIFFIADSVVRGYLRIWY